MKTSYKPSKLPAIAAQVRKEHPTSSEIKNYQLDNSFLDEVRQWAKLPKADVDGEAIAIPIRKVRLLANYVPTNSLHLPLLNLTRILFLRANEEITRSLFILWKSSTFSSVKMFFRNSFIESGAYFFKVGSISRSDISRYPVRSQKVRYS